MPTVTASHLLDRDYLQRRAQLIDPQRAAQARAGHPHSGGTVYLTAADENGIVVKTPGTPMVGRMLIQPDVEDASGQRRKLDDVLGPWFAVIGWQTDPQAALGDADRACWRALGARFVRIDRARCGSSAGARMSSPHGTACVEDVDNQFSDWIQAHPGGVLVLRPDRYIAAQCGAAELAHVTRQFIAFTREPQRDERLAA